METRINVDPPPVMVLTSEEPPVVATQMSKECDICISDGVNPPSHFQLASILSVSAAAKPLVEVPPTLRRVVFFVQGQFM